MRLVYPPDQYETFENNTFLIGSVELGSTLALNGAKLPLSKQGFFAHRIVLQPGDNPLNLSEQKNDDTVETKSLFIKYKKPPLISELPAQPEFYAPFAFPSQNVGILPGEIILLMCLAPPNAKVMGRIDWLMSHPIELFPISEEIDSREGVFGQLHQVKEPWPQGIQYAAYVHVPSTTSSMPDLSVEYIVAYQQGHLTFEAQGTLSILPGGNRLHGVVTTANAITRTQPNNGARRTPLLSGTAVEITGFEGDFYKVRLNHNDHLWVLKQDIQQQETPVYPLVLPIHCIQTQVDADGFRLIIPIGRAVLYDIVLEADKILITLYGVVSCCDVIHYHPQIQNLGLEQIQWTQTSPETVAIEVRLNTPLEGIYPQYDETQHALVYAIKTAKSREVPFVIVIDPGHGGDETGSTAPDGTPEKDLNLTMALKLQYALSQIPQLKVILTRHQDESVSLAHRVAKAISAKANLLLSLHHNALPDGRDPMTEHGVSTYYYHSFALPLARQLQTALVTGTEFADYGVLYDSLYVCRVMEMPAILLELGFLTHPEDAERCLDTGHQDKVVQNLAEAIKSYIQNR